MRSVTKKVGNHRKSNELSKYYAEGLGFIESSGTTQVKSWCPILEKKKLSVKTPILLRNVHTIRIGTPDRYRNTFRYFHFIVLADQSNLTVSCQVHLLLPKLKIWQEGTDNDDL